MTSKVIEFDALGINVTYDPVHFVFRMSFINDKCLERFKQELDKQTIKDSDHG